MNIKKLKQEFSMLVPDDDGTAMDWFENVLDVVKKESTCAECGGRFWDPEWKYGKSGGMYHTGCLLKNTTRPLALVKNAIEKERNRIFNAFQEIAIQDDISPWDDGNVETHLDTVALIVYPKEK